MRSVDKIRKLLDALDGSVSAPNDNITFVEGLVAAGRSQLLTEDNRHPYTRVIRSGAYSLRKMVDARLGQGLYARIFDEDVLIVQGIGENENFSTYGVQRRVEILDPILDAIQGIDTFIRQSLDAIERPEVEIFRNVERNYRPVISWVTLCENPIMVKLFLSNAYNGNSDVNFGVSVSVKITGTLSASGKERSYFNYYHKFEGKPGQKNTAFGRAMDERISKEILTAFMAMMLDNPLDYKKTLSDTELRKRFYAMSSGQQRWEKRKRNR